MLNLKKTAVAVLALSSGAVFAGTMGPVCSAVNVTIPCESTAWNFGGQALYLETGSGEGNFPVEATVGTTTSYGNLDNHYNWGFRLEGSYHFNTGNDFNINWLRVEKSRTASFTGPVTLEAGPVVLAATVDGSPDWNQANFEFGQRVDFGDDKAVRFHGGVQYTRISDDISVVGTGAVDDGPAAATYTHDGSLNAFGPRMGAAFGYGWGNGLGIYAAGATALLVGNHSFSDTYTADAGATATRNGSVRNVVPELEAALGLEYTYAMAQGDLMLEAGWMWVNYFHATLHDHHNYITGVNTGVHSHDFSLQGPYFGLKWYGNVA